MNIQFVYLYFWFEWFSGTFQYIRYDENDDILINFYNWLFNYIYNQFFKVNIYTMITFFMLNKHLKTEKRITFCGAILYYCMSRK